MHGVPFAFTIGSYRGGVVVPGQEVGEVVLLGAHLPEHWRETPSTYNVEELLEELEHLRIFRSLLFKHLHNCNIITKDVDHLPTPFLSPNPGRYKNHVEFFQVYWDGRVLKSIRELS